MLLREYVDSLDSVAKSRYFDKLKTLGLAATDDPYASGYFQNMARRSYQKHSLTSPGPVSLL